jgi:hypothetical protein
MGLLDLFLNNQTLLDIEPTVTPGNGPIGTPTGEFNTGVTQFVQTWTSNNPYLNTFTGGNNTGIQPPTLAQTGLDVDDLNYIASTSSPLPDTVTNYPATVKGGLGQSALQFLQIWTPVINYNDVVAGAGTSPLAQSLPETGLDNTDASSVPTTVSPINNTNYPNLATGEYNSVSNQYNQVYGPNNTYLNNYNPNVQPNSLADTGLDVENIGLVSTTIAPSTNTPYPSLAAGEFGGQSNNFNQVYTPNNTYLNTFNPQTQPDTVTQGQTGLDNTNPLSAPTTTTPIDSTQYPQFVQGEFNGAPNLYNQIWGPNNQYIVNYNPNIQPDTVTQGETGLDNTNFVSSPTAIFPNTPTNYPNQATGEFGGNANQYGIHYTPFLTYEDDYVNNPDKFDTLQTVTLDQTGLDNSSTFAAPTTNTFVQWDISTPPQLPPQTYMGEFGGAPNAYWTIYTPNFNQGYLDRYNDIVSNAGNPQIHTIEWGKTGLDVENPSTITFSPNAVSAPTNYPQFVQGEFNSSPTQYNQIWGPTNQYIINYDPNIQPNTLSQTGLDIENSSVAPTTTVPVDPTDYPQFVQGEFNGAPNLYIQNWDPNNEYFNVFNPTSGNTKQVITLGQTGLDNTDAGSAPAASIPNSVPITPPQLPIQTYMGIFQDAAQPFIQQYTPSPGSGYIDTYNSIIANAISNAQVKTILDPSKYGTGLDNTNPQASQTTFIPIPVGTPVAPAILPAQTYMGEFQGAPQQFTPQYNPNPGQSYLDNYNTIVNDTTNIQVNTLDETGLDIENPNTVTTTPIDPTVYPPEVTGELGTPPSQFLQEYTPTNKYYNFMKINYQAH